MNGTGDLTIGPRALPKSVAGRGAACVQSQEKGGRPAGGRGDPAFRSASATLAPSAPTAHGSGVHTPGAPGAAGCPGQAGTAPPQALVSHTPRTAGQSQARPRLDTGAQDAAGPRRSSTRCCWVSDTLVVTDRPPSLENTSERLRARRTEKGAAPAQPPSAAPFRAPVPHRSQEPGRHLRRSGCPVLLAAALRVARCLPVSVPSGVRGGGHRTLTRRSKQVQQGQRALRQAVKGQNATPKPAAASSPGSGQPSRTRTRHVPLSAPPRPRDKAQPEPAEVRVHASGRRHVLLTLTPGTLTPGRLPARHRRRVSAGGAPFSWRPRHAATAAASRVDTGRTEWWGPPGVCAAEPGTGKMCTGPRLRRPLLDSVSATRAPRTVLQTHTHAPRGHRPCCGGRCCSDSRSRESARRSLRTAVSPAAGSPSGLLSPTAVPLAPSHRAFPCP